ncbi:unnamed protein product (mitochondrion) [Plasmodiophora brassicae]|uniref:Fe2OG dioxygenase domain-containing protein n=1 Tax=Plasmodiophora brassicae TaxID=37360 RepID=A0A3P3Y1F6_PLABS|nr:unnamed protein product [Plasmodiophora brassicae]
MATSDQRRQSDQAAAASNAKSSSPSSKLSVPVKIAIVVAVVGVAVSFVALRHDSAVSTPVRDDSRAIVALEDAGDSDKTTAGADKVANHPQVNVTFYNVHQEPCDILWTNDDGKEVKMETIEAGGSRVFTSYVTHLWIWRTTASQEYIKSVLLDTPGTFYSYSSVDSSFQEQYQKEHGFPWINVVPRGPMIRWVPDPVAVGHEQTYEIGPGFYTERDGVPDPESKLNITLVTEAVIPKVFVIENFLSADECDHIVELAIQSGQMKRSGVKTTGELVPTRTSYQMWLKATETNIIENIFKRGYNLMQIPFGTDWNVYGEELQVLRYQVTQEYQPHEDFFKPTDYPTYKAVQAGQNRYATLFLYLSDVDEGGETVFPRAHGTYVENACQHPEGVKVKAKKGRAALFFSMLPDGNLDTNSLHGGCPVIEGTKWAANFWLWDPKFTN